MQKEGDWIRISVFWFFQEIVVVFQLLIWRSSTPEEKIKQVRERKKEIAMQKKDEWNGTKAKTWAARRRTTKKGTNSRNPVFADAWCCAILRERKCNGEKSKSTGDVLGEENHGENWEAAATATNSILLPFLILATLSFVEIPHDLLRFHFEQ